MLRWDAFVCSIPYESFDTSAARLTYLGTFDSFTSTPLIATSACFKLFVLSTSVHVAYTDISNDKENKEYGTGHFWNRIFCQNFRAKIIKVLLFEICEKRPVFIFDLFGLVKIVAFIYYYFIIFTCPFRIALMIST